MEDSHSYCPYCGYMNRKETEKEYFSKMEAISKDLSEITEETKTVYEKLDAKKIEDHPNIDGVISGLHEGDLRKVANSMGNVLERVTAEDYPIIEELKQVMKEEGALNAMMSGSGPNVFGIYDDKEVARNAQQKIKELGLTKQVYVVNVHNNRRK